jgi:hypothetical protein
LNIPYVFVVAAALAAGGFWLIRKNPNANAIENDTEDEK